MEAKVRKSTLRTIEKVEDEIGRTAERLVRERLVKVAQKLLDKFQVKVKTPARLV